MPELYGSQHLFWYQFFATGLNALSVIVLAYFLVERARSGSSGIYHCLAAFERCLPVVGTLAATVEVRVEESR